MSCNEHAVFCESSTYGLLTSYMFYTFYLTQIVHVRYGVEIIIKLLFYNMRSFLRNMAILILYLLLSRSTHLNLFVLLI